jgi:hypothetical protein
MQRGAPPLERREKKKEINRDGQDKREGRRQKAE